MAVPELKKHTRLASMASLVKQHSMSFQNKDEVVGQDELQPRNSELAFKNTFSQSPSLRNVNIRNRMQTLLKLEIDEEGED